MLEIKGHYTTAKVMIDTIDDTCRDQIKTFVNHRVFNKPVAIMPDTHAGKGSVIGFTMPLSDEIIPNVIGVDIGCGMLSFKLDKAVEMDFADLDREIRARVPFGMETHSRGVIHMKNEFPWERVKELAAKFVRHYREEFGVELTAPDYSQEWFTVKVKELKGSLSRFIGSLGTLGGGNHFIELGVGEGGDQWFTIHSGSRNFGKRVCDLWQDRASYRKKSSFSKGMQDEIAEIKATTENKQELKEKIDVVKAKYKKLIAPNGLESLTGEEAAGYLFDMIFAQVYASVNRELMMKTILDIIGQEAVAVIETVHNYIDFQDFVIRKGAIRSYEGEQMIIPFNMRDGILLCEGKSNDEWNNSAPHGAGRVMSRSQARKKLDVAKFKDDMVGIFSTSVGRSTIDEAPDSYKDAATIEEAIGDTATIIDRIKPIFNMKDCG